MLRSALWSQRGEDGKLKRVVTWGTAKGIESIVFSGGIIMLSNRPLADMPELRAIRTRISHLHLQATDQEIAALMRQIALKGFRHGEQSMTSDDCQMVCEYLITESLTKLAHLDLRLLDNAFRDSCCGKRAIPSLTGRHLLRPDWTDGSRNSWLSPVTGNRMKTCGPSKPCSTNTPASWLHRRLGAGCGARAGQVSSVTSGHWSRSAVIQVETPKNVALRWRRRFVQMKGEPRWTK